jgi:predicted NBD/HSP70 family sugar kinase
VSVRLACVEVGASGVQTVLLDGVGPDAPWRTLRGAHRPAGHVLAIATPGLIAGGRVVAASNLGWLDVDPAQRLGLAGPAVVLANDAQAAALGEWVLRAAGQDLVFVGLGTGVGGAVVSAGSVTANLLGHLGGFGAAPCPCGLTGCLETVAAGWALPRRLGAQRLRVLAEHLADAIRRTPQTASSPVVLAGGLTRRHPVLVELLRAALGDREVSATAAPQELKSAAAWGLARLVVDGPGIAGVAGVAGISAR